MRAALLALLAVVALAGAAGAQETPANPHGALALPCADCHQADAWRPARVSERFNHAKSGFALDGAHVSAKCTACHQSLEFKGTPATCASCHKDVHLGELGASCSRCHGTRSFTEHSDMFRAHQQTRFPLEGAHAAVACQSCHPPAPAGGLTWLNRPTACAACHAADLRGVKSPDHVAAGFSTDCTTCHDRTRWSGGRFDHAATNYPLEGAHASGTCADCHANGVYRGHDRTCVSCHQQDYAAAAIPPHAAGGFPTDCTMCHAGTTAWTGAAFDHGTTRFVLSGAHLAATCKDCHSDGTWRGRAMECLSCHSKAWEATSNPSHAAAGFSQTCTQCHGTTQWRGVVYDHSGTAFPLVGAHIGVTCASCHGDGVYRGKPSACASCHQDDYDRALAPNHKSSGFPVTCTDCHGMAGWQGAQFNHAATRFPLTGGHAALSCMTCHADGVWRGRSMECIACHQDDYDRTVTPNHRASQFPTECTSCHTTAGWPGATFNHSASQFPLTGAHLAVSCGDCHADGVYDGKPTTCVSCHRTDYDRAAQPPHASLTFPTDCTSCHTTSTWPGGRYDHATTRFPLTGAHVPLACAQCHGDGVYRGKPMTCVACHQAAYDGATDPNHRTARFPTECTSCHTTTGWAGARFDHDTQWFPIYSGAHAGRWSSCATCHTSSSNYSVFTCLTCHEHNQASMDEKHRERTGYRYDSQACYSCHPRGTH